MHIPLKTYLESIPGFFGIRTEEEPQHEVIFDDSHGFQVRQYGATVQARTMVQGDRDSAMDEGFRRLAGYIFGENSQKKQFEMTTPVLQNKSETLSMTTPVLQSKTASGWEMAFVLPSDVSREEAPVPQDGRIEVVDVPGKLMATLRYTGNQTEEKGNAKTAELLELVKEHGYKAKSDVVWAQYDQPFAIPFLKRNEVQVEIERAN